MREKLTEEERKAAQRACDARWKKNNPEKLRGYRAKWRAKRAAKKDEGEYSPEKQKAAAVRLLARAAEIAEAKMKAP